MDTKLIVDPKIFQVLSALLSYPEQELLAALPELEASLPQDVLERLQPVFKHLRRDDDLIDLQEEYVATFDRRAAHSLHLFEHVHGESRDRGQAMVDLRLEYLRYGLEPGSAELPDYVPLFLEFLGQIPAEAAANLLGDAIHVLARLGGKLNESDSPYACIFAQLMLMTDVQPLELPEPSEGDLEETEITFGPNSDIMAPFVQGTANGAQAAAQPIVFHRPSSKAGKANKPAGDKNETVL